VQAPAIREDTATARRRVARRSRPLRSLKQTGEDRKKRIELPSMARKAAMSDLKTPHAHDRGSTKGGRGHQHDGNGGSAVTIAEKQTKRVADHTYLEVEVSQDQNLGVNGAGGNRDRKGRGKAQ